MTDMIVGSLKVAGIFVVCYPVIMTAIILGCKYFGGKKEAVAMKAIPEAA